MMQSDHAVLWREYLATSNLIGLRSLWRHLYPNMPQPAGDYEVQVLMHSARTQSESIPLKLRLYSHQWLLANDLPSHLPDQLKPMAERIGGTFVKGVGISVGTTSSDPEKVQAAKAIQRAMETAVCDAFADGRTDAPFLRQRMDEARGQALRGLGRPRVTVNFIHNR